MPDFSDHLSRLQRVATDSLGKTPLLEIHSFIMNVVAIPCNKENWFVGKTVTFYPKMCLKINGSAKTEWHTPNMHAPAYGLQPKAQGNSSLEFKEMGCLLAWENDHLGLGCWDERSWCGLLDECLSQFWKSILDITVVGNARTYYGCIGCSIDGKKNSSLSPGRPRTIHWVTHHTSAISDVSYLLVCGHSITRHDNPLYPSLNRYSMGQFIKYSQHVWEFRLTDTVYKLRLSVPSSKQIFPGK